MEYLLSEDLTRRPQNTTLNWLLWRLASRSTI